MLLQIFVVLVVVLTTSVVVIFYICLLPRKYEESLFWTIYHLIFGHWLLCNIVFHYFRAAFTDPGSPNKVLCHSYQVLSNQPNIQIGSLLMRISLKQIFVIRLSVKCVFRLDRCF